jgi:hypothetical protein
MTDNQPTGGRESASTVANDQQTDDKDDSSTVRDDVEEVETTDTVNSLASFSGSYKVLGELSDSNGAAGVVGRNTASSGDTYGVVGETESDGNLAAGVQGVTTSTNQGVDGRAYDDESNLGEPATSESVGVMGRSDKSSGYGVLGWSTNHIGILGRSDDSNSAGVFAYNSTSNGTALHSNGDALIDGSQTVKNSQTVDGNQTVKSSQTVSGDQTVEGSHSVSKTGVEVYLGSSQSIAGSRTRTQIEFDTVVQDDFSGWDGANYQYEIPEDGTYQVSAQAAYLTMPDGTLTEIWVSVNGADRINISARGTDTIVASKALMGLSSGDSITVDTAQSDSSSHDLNFGRNIVFLTVVKIG